MPQVGDDYHSLLSPSRAPRFLRCVGSVALEEFTPNISSNFADEGSAKHTLFQMVFNADQIVKGKVVKEAHTHDFLGQDIYVKDIYAPYKVTFDFAEPVQKFVDEVRRRMEPGDILLVEQRVHYGDLVGVPNQSGSADIQIIHVARKELEVIDAKFGRGVQVVAEGNEQARLYGAASLDALELAYDIDTVRNTIHQPDSGDGQPTEEMLTVDELKTWVREVARPGCLAAYDIYERVHLEIANNGGEPVQLGELNPGEKQCRFCRAKPYCPALTAQVIETVGGAFIDLDAVEKPGQALSAGMLTKNETHALSNEQLAVRLRLVPLIQGWCNDVLALGDARLLAGQVVPGFKVVQGKRGNRAWTDEAAVIKVLQRNFGKAEAVKPEEPISPAQAEKTVKRLKATKQDFERVWKTLSKYITQSDGKPAVVPEDDPRPAFVLPNVAEAFVAVDEDLSDLA